MTDPTIRVPTCPNCGTLAVPGEAHCRHCGTPLVPPTIAAPSAPTQQQQGPPMPTIPVPPPGVPPVHAAPPPMAPKKRRSPLLMGCLIFLAVLVMAGGLGGLYVWRRSSYTPPERKAPDIPERVAGTLTEFPVDNDPDAPLRPTSVETEALGGATAKSSGSSATKLPPGVDRTGLARGATSMTSSTYRPRAKTASTGSSTPADTDIYICVLRMIPNRPRFGDELATSIVKVTSGQQTGVRVQSSRGAIYTGSRIRSSQGHVYVLRKQADDILILIYSADPSNQSAIDRLAQSVGNGEGLMDYPEVKDSLWTLPASIPSGLTLQEINTVTGDQIENAIATSGSNQSGDEVQRILSQMRPFIPARLTGARYTDASRQEWVTLTFQYDSTFQAWRTWLLARGALGLSGAQSTTVRDVTGLYLVQDGKGILVFQKGPYLIFVAAPPAAQMNNLIALGNQFQV
ncbi:MAG TPA: zinc ribbon domain-containing protein [Pyrinomonadaceae bacterium]|nr:zinc ribbon domain-containing protein [Pyrinomonadaceae bacterium]